MAKANIKKERSGKRTVAKTRRRATSKKPSVGWAGLIRISLDSIRAAIVKSYPWLAKVLLSLWRLALAFLCFSAALWLLAVPNWHWAISQFDADMFLKYVTVLIWPFTVAIALLVIRPDVPKILSRGFTFFFPWGGSVEVSGDGASQPAPASSNRETLEDAVQEQQEIELTSNDDVTRKSGVTGYVLDPRDQVELVAHFERANSFIKDTQLQALTSLGAYQAGLGAEDLQSHYEKFLRLKSPLEKASAPDFFGFMRFLSAWFFVDYLPSEKIFKITDIGMKFLEYRTDQKLSLSPANMKQ